VISFYSLTPSVIIWLPSCPMLDWSILFLYCEKIFTVPVHNTERSYQNFEHSYCYMSFVIYENFICHKYGACFSLQFNLPYAVEQCDMPTWSFWVHHVCSDSISQHMSKLPLEILARLFWKSINLSNEHGLSYIYSSYVISLNNCVWQPAFACNFVCSLCTL
jgi:hypothetical protein